VVTACTTALRMRTVQAHKQERFAALVTHLLQSKASQSDDVGNAAKRNGDAS